MTQAVVASMAGTVPQIWGAVTATCARSEQPFMPLLGFRLAGWFAEDRADGLGGGGFVIHICGRQNLWPPDLSTIPALHLPMLFEECGVAESMFGTFAVRQVKAMQVLRY